MFGSCRGSWRPRAISVSSSEDTFATRPCESSTKAERRDQPQKGDEQQDDVDGGMPEDPQQPSRRGPDGGLRGPLRPMVEELLSEQAIKNRGLFEPTEVRRIIDTNLSGREDLNLQVFQLLTLELWMRTFLA